MTNTAPIMLVELDTPPEWEAIVRAHNHRVMVLLLGMSIRVERAKELAQMTWMRLLESHRAGKLEQLDFPGLALAQARFIALDELRKDRTEVARLEPLETTGSLTIPDGLPSAEHRLVSREELSRALGAISRCSPAAQQIFRLIYDDPGMPHAVAAQKVGLSVQRVRQIICEVRKKMRAAIEEETIDE